MKKYNQVTAINCTALGFEYFVSRPYLWLAPLIATLLSFLLLLTAFFGVAYISWPVVGGGWSQYTWEVFKSFGYASATILVLWVSLFPIILNFAFENMIGKILQDLRVEVKEEGMLQATLSSVQIIFRTLGWRLLWPLSTLVALFIFGSLALCLAQIGMGHIAIIDAIDLSMAIQGVPGNKRIKHLKARTLQVLLAGLIAGMLSMILTVTIIGWLFWLPSVYAGCALWSLSWKERRIPPLDYKP